MTERDDLTLLCDFATTASEAAFTTLVQRHINLVYSTARRSVGNVHAAEEISQAVFIILARKANRISRKTILSGWLYQTTRLTAANFLRGEIRRHQREQEAYMQSTLNEPDTNLWRQIAPLLDDALDKLGEQDRNVVVLRFFENKNLSEVGAALGTSEDAAKMRVGRALEKLRKFFMKRGVSSTTAILAGALSTNSIQAAPAVLAKSITAAAITKGTAASGSTLILAKGVLKIMAWQKMKTAMVVGAAVIFAAGTTTLIAQHPPQTNAAIPYKMLDDACQFADSFDQSKLVLRMLITSKNKSVHPADIRFTIQSASQGLISVEVSTNGKILNLPHSEELRRENPSVVANQPKGTLRMTFNAYMPLPKELTFPYRRLGDAVAEANNGIARANKMSKADFARAMSSFKDKVHTVMFSFPTSRAGKATIEIAAASGTQRFTADAHGFINLKMDATLLVENPAVTISEKPLFALPAPD